MQVIIPNAIITVCEKKPYTSKKTNQPATLNLITVFDGKKTQDLFFSDDMVVSAEMLGAPCTLQARYENKTLVVTGYTLDKPVK